MKLYLASIFFIASFFLGNGQTIAEHYQTKDFDVAIFPKEYKLHGFEKRFTPTIEEVLQAENALKMQLKGMKVSVLYENPIIHKNLKNYRRQYFGIFGENGERILFINAFWDDDFSYWLDNEVSVDDGGSYFWNIKYDIKKNSFKDFMVNGIT